jgi:succinate dehydrogenase hydrophobic anchor subunit
VADNPLGVGWMTWLAKLMVIAFVLAACGHGVHGVLEIFDDYFTAENARRWARNVVITYAILASLIAIYIIWTA